MSTTTQGIDARTSLAAWCGAVTGMTVADIKAIPADKWTSPFGGCTRPANALLADTITMLVWTTAALKGETSDAYDKMEALAGELVDQTAAISAFTTASAAFGEALTSASEEFLQSSIMTPWQMPTPALMVAHIAVSHIWYHDGQFNYIQSLLGDEKVHWMGE